MTAEQSHLLRFRRVALGVFGLFFLVIAAGVTVRVLGAGMGCPDWPTCYGQLIPPTHESQLPPDYRERYAVAGRPAEPFDPRKTWAEYLNRMVSVLAGIGVVAMVGYALVYLRGRPDILRWVIAVPVLLLIQALLGWRVVATYLAEHMITLHMLFSLLLTIAVLLAWANTFLLRERPLPAEWRVYELLGWGSWLLLLVQVLLGASVRAVVSREGVDSLSDQIVFLIHRSFSWFVLGGWAYYQWRLFREPVRQPFARRWALWTLFALVVQVFSGAAMAYLAFSPILQVLHLVVALFAVNSGFISLYFLRHTRYDGAPQSIPQLSA